MLEATSPVYALKCQNTFKQKLFMQQWTFTETSKGLLISIFWNKVWGFDLLMPELISNCDKYHLYFYFQVDTKLS